MAVVAGVCLVATTLGPAHGAFQRLGLTAGDLWLVAGAVVLVRRGRFAPGLAGAARRRSGSTPGWRAVAGSRPMDISCGFAPSAAAPDLVAAAEQLGYRRAWMYDSPALYGDVWVALSRAAERTSTIGLGPGVLVPSLRHVMVTAAATAGLAELAPGRVALGIGTGFTGRLVLGQSAMRWAEVEAYVAALRALLAGEAVPWDGGVIQMIHPEGYAAARPLEVPILISAMGPRGLEVAHRIGDGVMSVSAPQSGFDVVDRRRLRHRARRRGGRRVPPGGGGRGPGRVGAVPRAVGAGHGRGASRRRGVAGPDRGVRRRPAPPARPRAAPGGDQRVGPRRS